MNTLIVKTGNEARYLFSLLLFIITLEVLISGTDEVKETRVTYIWKVKLCLLIDDMIFYIENSMHT